MSVVKQRQKRRYSILLSFFVVFPSFAQPAPHPFTVYAFIPWHHQQLGELPPVLKAYGLHPIKIIYEERYMQDGKLDPDKLKAIAKEAMLEPDVPVSFDVERGNRFHPETVIPHIHRLLSLYRSYHPKAMLGIYGTIPQNTYAWKSSTADYEKLNNKYQPLVADLDFVSPVLYNYDGNDFKAWSKSARYNMALAKKYASGKPIIPFISPTIRMGTHNLVKKGSIVLPLSETAMRKRLTLLYELGASGCILWTSSQERTYEGAIPQFDPKKSWGKAVIQFVRKFEQE